MAAVMNPQDKVARQVREQLGALMIELMVLKTELDLKDEQIKKLQEELAEAKPDEPQEIASSEPSPEVDHTK